MSMKKLIASYLIFPSLLVAGGFLFAPTVNAAGTTPYQTVNLETGWSIISTPRVLSSHEFSIAETSDNLDIYLLNPGSVSGWQTMQEAIQTEFQPLFAYFINNKTDQTQTLKFNYDFNLSPEKRLFQRTLNPGWNAVGVASPDYVIKQGASSGDTNNPNKILNSIIGSISQAVDFTADQSDLDSVKIGNTWASKVASEVNSLKDFRELKGYAVFVTETTDDYLGSQNINDGFEFSVSDNNPTAVIAGSEGSTLFTFQVRSLYDLSINSLTFSHSGTGDKDNINDFKLYNADNDNLLGSTTSIDNDNNLIFSSLTISLSSRNIKKMKLVGNASSTAIVGRTHKFTLASTTLDHEITITGLPISNILTMSFPIGSLDVDAQAAPVAATILSGAVDQEIACWRFTASSTSGATGVGEGFNVHSIKVTHIGSATRDDLSNLKLKVAGIQLGSTVAELNASNAADFDLSASPLSINSGTSKTVCAYSDVASGIWTLRTIMFEITQYTDVTAYGANSGGLVTITTGGWGVYRRQVGNLMTVGQGTLAIAIDAAYNPSGQTYVKGTENRLFTALKFSTASTEGARITKLRLTLGSGGTCVATDISNVTLWDGTTQIAGPASVIGYYVTFGSNTIGWDTTGLFDLEVSKVKTILVKADVPTGATTGHQCKLSIAASTDVWADGLSSQYDLPSENVTLVSGDGNLHTIAASGSLTISKSNNSPASQSYIRGSLAKEFLRFNLAADSGEDIAVSSILVRCFRSTGTNVTCVSGDVSNVRLQKSDGSYYGSAFASPVATASFSGSLTVKAAETESLKVIADIPATSNATSVHFEIVSGSVDSDLTSTGVSSAADIVETGSAIGDTMTISQGSLTVSAATTPGDQTVIIGATEVPFVGLVMTAGTDENIRVTMVKLSTCTTDEGTITDVSRIALYDGTTRLTTNKNLNFVSTGNHTVTFSASDFLNSQGIDITKGQQKTITVKADLPSSASPTHTLAFGIAPSWVGGTTTTDVAFVGLSSNTTPNPTLTLESTGTLTGVNYLAAGDALTYEVTVVAKQGVLTIDTTAD